MDAEDIAGIVDRPIEEVLKIIEEIKRRKKAKR